MMLKMLDPSLSRPRIPVRKDPGSSSARSAEEGLGKKPNKLRPVAPILVKSPSGTSKSSYTSGSSSGGEDGFDQSNSRPTLSLDQTSVHGELPDFVQQRNRSNSWSDVFEWNRNGYPGRTHLESVPGVVHAAANGSVAHEYRSVIDDLTVENRKLRERLRKYEDSSRSPYLEKDRLFEVKVHGLPAQKKRELEETLREFAASFDTPGPRNYLNMKVTSGDHCHHTSGDVLHHPSSSSTSNSRPADSGYASVLISGPTPTITSNGGLGQQTSPEREYANEVKVQSSLRGIPAGPLLGHSTVMTEGQRKNAVVRRLEQLFTGKTGSIGGPQQEEISNSATRADRAAVGLTSVEGLREAHVLPYEMEIDAATLETTSDDTSLRTQLSRIASDSTPGDKSPLDQRPTRPSDLDPNRTQIPSDNADYIRHLGLSAPQFTKMESADAAADADGWIFLNLLTNMAQLHIINVTPSFVRSAVADLSEKLQMSRDGKKVRWRGGTEGTRLSSDSEPSSDRNRSPHEIDGCGRLAKKRRKIDVGRFASVPIDSCDAFLPVDSSQQKTFHYKPLFHHHHQNSTSKEGPSSVESGSALEPGQSYRSDIGKLSKEPRDYSQGASSTSSGGLSGEDGAIVFYSGAQFCIDLSRDRGNIRTPAHITRVGKDGHSNNTQDALGCSPRTRPYHLHRTASGSNIPFRPFKDYAQVPEILQTEETRPKTPDLVAEKYFDMDFPPGWASDGDIQDQSPLEFNASGLGGTVPADHFITRVGTRRTILDGQTRAKQSNHSATGTSSKRFLHGIPRPFLDSLKDLEGRTSPDYIASGIATLPAFRSLPPQSRSSNLPVEIQFISSETADLDPSPLPAPSGYYAATSSSSDDSDGDISSSSDSHLQHD